MYLIPFLTILTLINLSLFIFSLKYKKDKIQTSSLISLVILIVVGWGILGILYPIKNEEILIEEMSSYDIILHNDIIFLIDKYNRKYVYNIDKSQIETFFYNKTFRPLNSNYSKLEETYPFFPVKNTGTNNFYTKNENVNNNNLIYEKSLITKKIYENNYFDNNYILNIDTKIYIYKSINMYNDTITEKYILKNKNEKIKMKNLVI